MAEEIEKQHTHEKKLTKLIETRVKMNTLGTFDRRQLLHILQAHNNNNDDYKQHCSRRRKAPPYGT